VTAPSTPSLSIDAALAGSVPLARLSARIQASQARMAAVSGLLPAPLRAELRPGPVDETGWTLLASNGAVAAKTRQLLPRLLQRLHESGWPDIEVKVRVLSQGDTQS
jgi:hypothetical protein